MARIRSLKPEFFTDEDVAKLSPLYRLAFAGMWCHADKAGRLEDRPTRLKVLVLPYDDVDFEDVIAELAAARFVIRYSGPDGRRYLQIRTFDKHQRPRTDEDESKIPPCQELTSAETAPSLRSDETVPAETLGKERKGKERREEGKGTEESDVPLRDTTPAVLIFPTVGAGAKTWELTEAQRAEWQGHYPGLDVLGECRKALAWVRANQPKTARGMPAFLVGWLNRTTNRGGTSRPTSLAAPAAPVLEHPRSRTVGNVAAARVFISGADHRDKR